MYEANLMSRGVKPVTLLICSLQIPHALAWEALGATTKNNVTSRTGGSQWDVFEDYSVKDVTTFCNVDVCHRLRTIGWLCFLCIRKANLCYKGRDGVLIWNFSTFQHKKWRVTNHNKESVRYHGIFHIYIYIYIYKTHKFFSILYYCFSAGM